MLARMWSRNEADQSEFVSFVLQLKRATQKTVKKSKKEENKKFKKSLDSTEPSQL